jgi:hypothetical protein
VTAEDEGCPYAHKKKRRTNAALHIGAGQRALGESDNIHIFRLLQTPRIANRASPAGDAK